MRVSEGSRKVSGRPSGSKIIIRYPKQVNVSSLIRVHLPCPFSRARFSIFAIPSETYCFLNTSLYETDRFLPWRPRDQI
jgi:hypothetical protein